MAATQATERAERLKPGGIPRWVRCYDNEGRSADRYTVVFTGKYRKSRDDEFVYLGMNSYPFHPQGIGMHGFSQTQIDVTNGWPPKVGAANHLGVRIKFEDLPSDCRKAVLQTYNDIWDLK